jgi:hypothetical protein
MPLKKAATTARRDRRLAAVKPLTVDYPYVRCHVLRHNFDAVGPIPGLKRRAAFGTVLTFRCENCYTVRFDVVSRLTGELLGREYVHPDDYRTDQRSMAEWRALFMDEMDASLMLNLEDRQQ